MNLVNYFNVNLNLLPSHTIDQQIDEKQLHITFNNTIYFVGKSKKTLNGLPDAFEFGKFTGVVVNDSGVMPLVDTLYGANGYSWYYVGKDFSNESIISYVEYTLEDLHKRKFMLFGKQNFQKKVLDNSRLIMERLFLAGSIVSNLD